MTHPRLGLGCYWVDTVLTQNWYKLAATLPAHHEWIMHNIVTKLLHPCPFYMYMVHVDSRQFWSWVLVSVHGHSCSEGCVRYSSTYNADTTRPCCIVRNTKASPFQRFPDNWSEPQGVMKFIALACVLASVRMYTSVKPVWKRVDLFINPLMTVVSKSYLVSP